VTAVAPTATAPTTATVAALAGRLRIAAGRIARDGSAQTQADGMTPSRIAALSVLATHGPQRMGELAERMAISAPTVSRLVECLGERGLVERVPDPDDHRATQVRLSAAGTARLTALRERGTGLIADRIAGLSPAELAALAAAMDVLERIAGCT
jgi:DNA-binding MarR family transcriptional regulator